MTLKKKDPDDVLDYWHDWAEWLEDDTIESSEWLAPTPEGLTIDSQTVSGTRAIVWLSGGTVGQTYALVNRITTAGGRTVDRTLRIQVAER